MLQPQNSPSSCICDTCDKTNQIRPLYTLTCSTLPVNTHVSDSPVAFLLWQLLCVDCMTCNHLKWDLLYWSCLHPPCVKSKSKTNCSVLSVSLTVETEWSEEVVLGAAASPLIPTGRNMCVTAVLESFIHLSCSSSFAQLCQFLSNVWLLCNSFLNPAYSLSGCGVCGGDQMALGV